MADKIKADNPFGALDFLHWNHDWNSYHYPDRKTLEKTASLMKDAGITWVRFDFLWQDIEPEKERFDFERYDLIVDIFTKNNINILGILDYSAGWAAKNSAWNSPPKENRLFADYAVKIINRYKGKIKYWEVWNEPDSPVYWNPQDGMKTYCELLKEVYLAAKKEDPQCRILNGGLAQGISSVNRLYDNGVKDYFDIMNLHFFDSPVNNGAIKRAESFVRTAYKIMKRNGDGAKDIWITETGCPGVKIGLNVKGWWLGKNPSEKKQAQWLKEIFTQLLKEEKVTKIFWAFFRDTSQHWDNGIDYFGLVRGDFSRKPSYKAYKKITEEWEKGRIK